MFLLPYIRSGWITSVPTTVRRGVCAILSMECAHVMWGGLESLVSSLFVQITALAKADAIQTRVVASVIRVIKVRGDICHCTRVSVSWPTLTKVRAKRH